MAKSRKGGPRASKGPSAVAEPGKAKVSEGTHLISEAMLRKLLEADRGKKQEIDGLVGELREMIGNAKEKHHLHTGVYAWIKKLDKMEPERAAEWWDTLLVYAQMSGVLEKIESVGKLALDAVPEEEEDGGEEAAPETSNVRQFGAGARGAPAAAE